MELYWRDERYSFKRVSLRYCFDAWWWRRCQTRAIGVHLLTVKTIADDLHHFIKPFGEPLYPVDGGRYHPARDHFHQNKKCFYHRTKENSQNNFVLICNDSAL